MAEAKKYKSLTAKMLGVLCIAAVLAVVVGFGGRVLGMAGVRQFYMAEEAVLRRVTEEANSFREYVAENNLASTDVDGVERWNREHRYTQLTIKGMDTTISSNAHGAELMVTSFGILVQYGQVADQAVEFTVNFRDGAYAVAILDSSEQLLEQIVNVGAILLGAMVFLLTVLLYVQHLTLSVQTLSRQVRLVSQGDLDRRICPQTDDEIGMLATDVDSMRLSILDKLQKEEAAWQANSQLITAISHDVRTPLTAMMGYLEILGEDELSPQERNSYLEICRNNALRLKSLTDELFGFFLVFGKPKPDQNPESFSVTILLDQIILEHQLRLDQEGFDLRLTRTGAQDGMLMVDVGHLRRVFDNLFSNVSKYADPEKPVEIRVAVEEKLLRVSMVNHIRPAVRQVESNRIGLQTCRKLIESMDGSFSNRKDQERFSVEFELPLSK